MFFFKFKIYKIYKIMKLLCIKKNKIYFFQNFKNNNISKLFIKLL